MKFLKKDRKLDYVVGRKKQYKLALLWNKGLTSNYKNFRILIDGNILDTIESEKELRIGKDVQLNDGTSISIRLKKGVGENLPFQEKLLVTSKARDLIPIGLPEAEIAYAYGILAFIGVVRIVVGLVAIIGRVDWLQEVGFGWPIIISGIVYFLLAYFTKRHSRLALAFGIILFALESIVSIMAVPRIFLILLSIGFLLVMGRGLRAMQLLKRNPQSIT